MDGNNNTQNPEIMERLKDLVEQFGFDQVLDSLSTLNPDGQGIPLTTAIRDNYANIKERFSLAERTARIGTWDWNVKTGELTWSPFIETIFGYERNTFPGTYQAFLGCIHEDDRQKVDHAIQMAVRNKSSEYRVKHRIVWPDGSVYWVQEIGDVLLDEQGNVTRMIGTVQDITEYQRVAEELIENGRFLDTVINSLPFSFVVLDLEYGVVMINKAAKRIYSGSTGSSCYQLMHGFSGPCSDSHHQCPIKQIKRDHKPVIMEHSHETEDGQYLPVEVHAIPVFDDQGELAQVIEMTFDIQERKKVEEELALYTVELELKSLELELANDRVQEEIEKTRLLHERTLPRLMPDDERIKVFGYYSPAQNLGGDFFDVISLGDNLLFYLIDVSGHGLDSAFVSVFIRNTITGYLAFQSNRADLNPTEIVRFLESRFRAEGFPGDYFICILLGIMNKADYTFVYTSMGFQVPPFAISPSGQFSELPCGGLPISSSLDQRTIDFPEYCVKIYPGSTILITTDGLVEQTSSDGELYLERFTNFLQEVQMVPPKWISSSINQDFQDFAKVESGDDDITYLVFQLCQGNERVVQFSLDLVDDNVVEELEKGLISCELPTEAYKQLQPACKILIEGLVSHAVQVHLSCEIAEGYVEMSLTKDNGHGYWTHATACWNKNRETRLDLHHLIQGDTISLLWKRET